MSALVVSLHDVSPLTREVFTAMLRELAEVGVTKTSLLVIPNHHRRGHMLDDAGFCRWVEGLAKAGHEVVIHGYYHQRTPRGDEMAQQRWITSVYTMGEGEFYDLSYDEAASLLARAREDFSKLDVPPPAGFIAPAWLLSSAALSAVERARFAYTTFLRGVHSIVRKYYDSRQNSVRSQSLVYSCRNTWRRACSLLWNATLRRRLQTSPLLRLGLHPPDFQHTGIWRQIRRFVRDETTRRGVMTYREFYYDEHLWSLAAQRSDRQKPLTVSPLP